MLAVVSFYRSLNTKCALVGCTSSLPCCPTALDFWERVARGEFTLDPLRSPDCALATAGYSSSYCALTWSLLPLSRVKNLAWISVISWYEGDKAARWPSGSARVLQQTEVWSWSLWGWCCLAALCLAGSPLAPSPCSNLMPLPAVGAIRKFLWGLSCAVVSRGAGGGPGRAQGPTAICSGNTEVKIAHSLKSSKADAQNCFSCCVYMPWIPPYLYVSGCELLKARKGV